MRGGSWILRSKSVKAGVCLRSSSLLQISLCLTLNDKNTCVTVSLSWSTVAYVSHFLCGHRLLLTCFCVFNCQTRFSHSQARLRPLPHPIKTWTPDLFMSTQSILILRIWDPFFLFSHMRIKRSTKKPKLHWPWVTRWTGPEHGMKACFDNF